MTLLEAMACARKVVVSKRKSLSFQDIIAHGVNGYTINSIDEVEIANTIHSALLSKGDVGVNARKMMEHHFSINVISILIEKLYSCLKD